MKNLEYKYFADVDLYDKFFDSLKEDYPGFEDWFNRKSKEKAFVLYGKENKVVGFMYLKNEKDIDPKIIPPLKGENILKVGTFKFIPEGTGRGEKFIKKILDKAIEDNHDMVYLTVFEKHDYLIRLFEKYGFLKHGKKENELVYARNMKKIYNDILLDYPYIKTNSKKYHLAIFPKYHSRLFPDSLLKTEPPDIVKDESHSNSIHKIYISAINDLQNLKKGDIIAIYRTCEDGQRAAYTSVTTSVCVVEEVRTRESFADLNDYLKYCSKYSVFSEEELKFFFRAEQYKYVIKFTYNVALKKRLIRKTLLEKVGLARDVYWGFFEIKDEDFKKIIELSETNENYFIN
ncbi:GNAT family N-acetyltransferase [Bartonella sp. DGB1]|uniref:GNAT family N-acetyltransferase n=1 Tax=Bartonella sp. DGB1 TaxID=3239807 RepID=UPI00352313A6